MPVVEAQSCDFQVPSNTCAALKDAAKEDLWLRPMQHLAGLTGAAGAEIPGTHTPESDMPESRIPESNKPERETPESDRSERNTSERDSPRAEENPSKAPPVEVVVVTPKPDWAILMMDRMTSAFRMVREGVMLAAVLLPWLCGFGPGEEGIDPG